jgi:hypothetical protein
MKHISLRLAWHDDGWNGHVCKKPDSADLQSVQHIITSKLCYRHSSSQ